MKTTYSILIVLHVLTVLGMIGLLLAEGRKAVKKVPNGVTHAGLTSMVLGIAMIVINAIRHNSDSAVALLNHTKFGIKFVVLAAILGIAFKYAKKPSITNQTWFALVGLSVLNFIIAGAWQ
jgi:cation transport ATPase